MALLFCPLIHGECQNEKCAWWDEVMRGCFALSLLDQLTDICRELNNIKSVLFELKQNFSKETLPFEPEE